MAPPPVEGPFRVASFGFLGEAKAPDLLIDAVALLPPGLNVQLDLAGFALPDYQDQLLAHARRVGIESRVRITGFVTEEEWFRHILQSSCAVQLRRHSNGESSGSVIDALSLGLPVITNLAACREMPGDAAVQVSPEVTAQELSGRIQAVLTDRAEWLRLHQGGLRYSQANTFETAARKALDAVAQL